MSPVTPGAIFQDIVLREGTFYSQTERLDQNLRLQWFVWFVTGNLKTINRSRCSSRDSMFATWL